MPDTLHLTLESLYIQILLSTALLASTGLLTVLSLYRITLEAEGEMI